MNLKYFKNHLKYLSLNFAKKSAWNQSWKLPILQAHRGHWLPSGQQNSLESLSEAKRQKYQMAEFDVQITKDGVPVLFHDFDLRHQLQKNISLLELNYSDLKKLIAVPTLTEVLLSSDRPEFLNVEVKSRQFDSPMIEEKIAEVIRKTKSADKIIFSSFNHWSLIKMKMILPDVPRALLVTQEKESWNWFYLNQMWLSSLVEPSLIHADHHMLDKDLVGLFKEQDLKLAAWTVNDLSRAKLLKSWGVDSLISDKILPYEI